jgi:hypothetical protein
MLLTLIEIKPARILAHQDYLQVAQAKTPQYSGFSMCELCNSFYKKRNSFVNFKTKFSQLDYSLRQVELTIEIGRIIH